MDCTISVREHNDCIVVCHKAFSLLLSVNLNEQASNNLICHFTLLDKDLYAAVAAPKQQLLNLAKRIASFIGAYVRITDNASVETELLRCLQRITLSPNNTATIMA